MLDALDGHFRRTGRKVYLSSEISVFYPGERRFAPDVLAVTDVEPHERMKWAVAREGKGLDFVLEVHVAGDRRKDEKTNVERYARLGIQEYFYFDRPSLRIVGWQLPAGSRGTVARTLPAHRATGRPLPVGRARPRISRSTARGSASSPADAALPDADEMIARLGIDARPG